MTFAALVGDMGLGGRAYIVIFDLFVLISFRFWVIFISMQFIFLNLFIFIGGIFTCMGSRDSDTFFVIFGENLCFD
jgi:hypothetical protein